MSKYLSVACALMCFWSLTARAGEYSDALTNCVVKSASPEERLIVGRWVYVALSRNPTFASLTKVSKQDVDDTNAAVGEMMMRLFTHACLDEAKLAETHEGILGFAGAIHELGQAAMHAMMADPSYAEVVTDAHKYIDFKKIEAALRDDK